MDKDPDAPRNLYVCTVYPQYPSEEMFFNLAKLEQVPGLNVIPLWIRAGYFSHRHPRSKPDPVQIQWRQRYVDATPEGEWMLILDSDELLFGALGRIPAWLDTIESQSVTELMDGNECLVAVVTEVRTDMSLLKRPRLVKKKQGMQYGKHTQKHDELDYNGVNLLGREYDDFATLDHLAFFHYKDGKALTIYSDKMKQPDEGVKITSFEEVLEEMGS